ncbi:SdpI family protein [Nocardia sp. CDC153]|uniref:SdpI family protein n=1 Tax=Nocardia sp. CDC153 TaxID=3112167 RepID=UPI002DB779A8|nr:SdpI family protein [Nocardia sp. CDC153]MEC3958215.1 SdpI family protein [Nocardia sp. CDC153]
MFVVALILFVFAAVAVVTGVLGFTGTLPGNRYFGVHSEAAVKSEAAFKLANKVAAPTSIVAGLLLAAAGMVALVAGGIPALIIAVVAVVISLFTLGAGAAAAEKALATAFPEEKVGGCGSACGACSLRDACETPAS